MSRRLILSYEAEQEMRQYLEKVGLTPSEIQIFIALCNLGSQPSSIVARNIGAKRTTTYHTLQRMAAKGFVCTSEESSTTYFHLNPLNEAITRLEQEKDAIDEKVECLCKISETIGSLKNTTTFSSSKYREYRGLAEVKKLKMKTIQDQTEVLTYRSSLPNQEFHLNIKDKSFWTRFNNKLTKQNTKIRTIMPTNNLTHSNEQATNTNRTSQLVQVKAVPEQLFPFEDMLELNILPDRILVLGDHFGIEIESKHFADLQRSAFELAWMGAQIIDTNRQKAQKDKTFFI